MILIWGWRVRFKTLGQGVFFCPSCQGDRHYSHKKGRRWFTLFFIPVIPLNHVGEEFVECDTCRNAFRLSVLQVPTTSALSEQLVAATREAIVAVVRAGAAGPQTVRVALEVLSSASGAAWNEQSLQADLHNLDVNGLPNRLTALARALNEHGRETFLASAVRVAAADGPLTDDERRILDHIAASLGMTQAHAHGVINQVTTQAGL
jgi:tellurite resistance protein